MNRTRTPQAFHSQRQTFFATDGDHVFLEVVGVLRGDNHVASSRSKICAPALNAPVRNLPWKAAASVAQPAGPTESDQSAPQVRQNVTTQAVFGQLDPRPVNEVKNMTRRGKRASCACNIARRRSSIPLCCSTVNAGLNADA